MKETDNIQIFVLIVLIFTTVIGVGFAGYSNGYKSGQKDALMGKYKYSLETNVIINIK